MSQTYAMLPERVKALVIDQVILVAAMYGVSEIFSLFETVTSGLKIGVIVFLFGLYEPLMVSFLGGTIGHTYSGITIKKKRILL